MKIYKIEPGMGNTFHIYLDEPMKLSWLGSIVGAINTKAFVTMLESQDKIEYNKENNVQE